MKEQMFICPGCGEAQTAEVSWSGQIGQDGEEEYTGPWIECLVCGLQGPLEAWKGMARRREDVRSALGGSSPRSLMLKNYMAVIEGFGERMFEKLKSRNSRDADFLDWQPSADEAQESLRMQVVRVWLAINGHDQRKVTEQCAHLANLAMGVDRWLGKKKKKEKEKEKDSQI